MHDVLPVRGRFSIQPSHFTERHGALVIIVLGESVVDIGIGAEGHPVTVSLALSAVLGLALTAALWWAYFGAEDDERAERAMVAADPAIRPALALAAYSTPTPMLLGIVALASGVKQAIATPEHRLPGRAWRWAAASRCSWLPARRSGTLRIGPDATG
jgi:low temperature requirement protein LtrA